ncbi:hypothetical protein HFO56_34095 [Rhizobium laguerreae]|uniref:hypothetical protein n=1 Tax=Rhizobium laguerreae TaxID=1076926 RepID=UPI001C909CE0|nr:hypothetical protein [Rhizobium laguerreae]MBY3157359.1 hypothetical protein [Rhizobium laguerreae]
MRVRFPFFYTADVVMGRSDRVRTETFLESFEVDVPEPTDADAPVALTYRSHGTGAYVFRHFNGRFLKEVTNPGGVLAKEFIPHDLNKAAHSIARDLIRSIDQPTQAIQTELKNYFSNPKYEAERKPNPTQVREWFSGTHARAKDKAERFAAGVVIFDGRFWFPVEEPKFGISRTGLDHLSVVDNPVDYASRINAQWGHPVSSPVFNVSARADVDAWCAANIDELRLAFDPRSLDIRIPEVFVFDRARHAVERAAMETLDLISASIRDRPDAVIGQWMEARRLLEQGDRDDAGWEEAVVQSIAGLLSDIRSIEKQREIEAIIDVWVEGTISLDISRPCKVAP